jgi:FAD/FMN-containing dehydrogenase
MQTPITRRRFLVRSAQLAVGAGVGVGLLSRAEGRGPTDGVSLRAWRELAHRLSGPLLRPGDPGYDAFPPPNNLRFASTLPGGIARCVDARDVAESIRWSREFRVPLVARGGGHSYAGYSTTTGLLIDLSSIDAIGFDASTGIATLGGGARNGAVYAALSGHRVAITHGRCPTVGVGGFFLGGGIGFNMRAHGFASDQLVGSELVTADGRVLALAPDSDLFWACRGGAGGNFGINTSFSVQTFPVAGLTVFDLAWVSRVEEVYEALLAALDAAPPGLGCRVRIDAATPEARAGGADALVGVLGQFTGLPEELEELLRPVYDVAEPDRETIERMDYWDAQLNFLATPGDPGFYQERSRFLAERPGAAAIATAFDWIRRWPGTTEGAHLVLFQTGHRTNALAPDATAFVHRDSTWLMTIALEWARDTSEDLLRRNRDWQDAFYEAMLPFATAGSFQNFPDPSLVDFLPAYYGANLPRLQRIKAEVDPARVFNNPQSIPPA